MNVEGDEYLFLVNTDHRLSENDKPTDLIDVINTRKDGRNTQQMRKYAAKALGGAIHRSGKSRHDLCQSIQRLWAKRDERVQKLFISANLVQ